MADQSRDCAEASKQPFQSRLPTDASQSVDKAYTISRAWYGVEDENWRSAPHEKKAILHDGWTAAGIGGPHAMFGDSPPHLDYRNRKWTPSLPRLAPRPMTASTRRELPPRSMRWRPSMRGAKTFFAPA